MLKSRIHHAQGIPLLTGYVFQDKGDVFQDKGDKLKEIELI